MIAEQNGTLYLAQIAPGVFDPTANWISVGPFSLTAANFHSYPGGQHPDFTASGGPIRFGFLRANSTGVNPSGTVTLTHGIDNWRVEVQH